MTDVMIQLPGTVSDARGSRREAELLYALQEIVDALDKRIPHLEHAGEAQIIADAARLRAGAMQRIALLRDRGVAALT